MSTDLFQQNPLNSFTSTNVVGYQPTSFSLSYSNEEFNAFGQGSTDIQEDVDMDVETGDAGGSSSVPQPPIVALNQSVLNTYLTNDVVLVIDTNILINHLDVMQQFLEDLDFIQRQDLTSAPGVRWIVIPGMVLRELDGLKRDTENDPSSIKRRAWHGRVASQWVREKSREGPLLKLQRDDETMHPSGNWRLIPASRDGLFNNDDVIRDCCTFFAADWRTVICTDDRNLQSEAMNHGILAIGSCGSQWSSRQLAEQLGLQSGVFSGRRVDKRYGPDTQLTEQREVDYMDVDVMTRPDARDSLHDDVVYVFTNIFRQVVGAVGGKELTELQSKAKMGMISIHAPEWQRQLGAVSFEEWSCAQCLEYLAQKFRVARYSRLEAFLTKRYSRGRAGARPGREWTREDWLTNLKTIRRESWEKWDEGGGIGIFEVLRELQVHLQRIFDAEFVLQHESDE